MCGEAVPIPYIQNPFGVPFLQPPFARTPEANYILVMAGLGPGPMLAASEAHAELGGFFAEVQAEIDEITAFLATSWEGVHGESAIAAHVPFAAWVEEQAGLHQSLALRYADNAASYTTMVATIPTMAELVQNHTLNSILIQENIWLLGMLTPAIIANELDYARMWMTSAGLVMGHLARSLADTTPVPVPPSPPIIAGSLTPIGMSDSAELSALVPRGMAIMQQIDAQTVSTFGELASSSAGLGGSGLETGVSAAGNSSQMLNAIGSGAFAGETNIENSVVTSINPSLGSGSIVHSATGFLGVTHGPSAPMTDALTSGVGMSRASSITPGSGMSWGNSSLPNRGFNSRSPVSILSVSNDSVPFSLEEQNSTAAVASISDIAQQNASHLSHSTHVSLISESPNTALHMPVTEQQTGHIIETGQGGISSGVGQVISVDSSMVSDGNIVSDINADSSVISGSEGDVITGFDPGVTVSAESSIVDFNSKSVVVTPSDFDVISDPGITSGFDGEVITISNSDVISDPGILSASEGDVITVSDPGVVPDVAAVDPGAVSSFDSGIAGFGFDSSTVDPSVVPNSEATQVFLTGSAADETYADGEDRIISLEKESINEVSDATNNTFSISDLLPYFKNSREGYSHDPFRASDKVSVEGFSVSLPENEIDSDTQSQNYVTRLGTVSDPKELPIPVIEEETLKEEAKNKNKQQSEEYYPHDEKE